MSVVGDEEEAVKSMQQQHLYLIFDDWDFGYSFYMVDLMSDASDLILEGYAREAATCLPPHFFRLQAKRGVPIYFTASGSKILAMHPIENGCNYDSGGSCFDVQTRTFAFIPRHTDEALPVYFPIGSKIFTVGSFSVHLLDIGMKKPPIGVSCSWSSIRDVPVNSNDAISHAIFPDGRTIFLSIGFVAVECTYSFHFSEDGSLLTWKAQGDWVLPFHGRGYFDSKLNTWIGLSLYREETGHICSCDLASATSHRRPDVKYTKDCLFTNDPDERHVGATLVYMEQKSKFCLVECITVNYCFEGHCSFEIENMDQEKTDHYMLRMTMFSLKYDENGDLTTGSRRIWYYKMPANVSRLVCQRPVAFWM